MGLAFGWELQQGPLISFHTGLPSVGVPGVPLGTPLPSWWLPRLCPIPAHWLLIPSCVLSWRQLIFLPIAKVLMLIIAVLNSLPYHGSVRVIFLQQDRLYLAEAQQPQHVFFFLLCSFFLTWFKLNFKFAQSIHIVKAASVCHSFIVPAFAKGFRVMLGIMRLFHHWDGFTVWGREGRSLPYLMDQGTRKGWVRKLGDHVSSQEARNLSKLQGEFLFFF